MAPIPRRSYGWKVIGAVLDRLGVENIINKDDDRDLSIFTCREAFGLISHMMGDPRSSSVSCYSSLPLIESIIGHLLPDVPSLEARAELLAGP